VNAFSIISSSSSSSSSSLLSTRTTAIITANSHSRQQQRQQRRGGSNSNNIPIMMKATTTKNKEDNEMEEVVEEEVAENNDPLLTPIPQKWYDEILLSQKSQSQSQESLSLLLPKKLAYPFWYDPHPIAKKCCDQLKDELPPYYNYNNQNQNQNQTTTGSSNTTTTTTTNTITLGKMYGVLVVSLDTEKKKSSMSIQQQQQLFYLKAFSGTMPRPQYGGSMITNEEKFVPLVYDRFAVTGSKSESLLSTAASTDGNDNERCFCYENEEENLNNLTKEIKKLELEKYCPKRIEEQNQLKKIEIELLNQLSDGKQKQNNNKSNRKKRRNIFRQQLIGIEVEKQHKQVTIYNSNMNNKESHKYFLKHNDEYRILEDQLVQESAYDQRQFKTIKYNVQNKLDEIQFQIDDYDKQIQILKEQRKQGSIDMQRKLFNEYKLLNVYGETKTPVDIFKDTILNTPPSGAGDCSAIKLFQYAFSNGYHPIALAEFWWGPSPHNININNNSDSDNNINDNDNGGGGGGGGGGEVARTHGNYYPCCRGKCEPILTRHMLLGTDVESDPLTEGIMLSNKKRRLQKEEDNGQQQSISSVLPIVYEDDWLVVVNKPHNVLSVPGRNIQDSIYTELKNQYPNATGPLLVHRLDYSTSGLLLATKDSNTHKHVQAQFIQRTVKKRYTALLEGKLMLPQKGTIDLPLAGDYLNRPMQKVDRGPEGKHAVTHYEIIDEGREEDSSRATTVTSADNEDDTDEKNKKIKNAVNDDGRERTRIHFYPVTGRTHQLRVQ
jgi:tRNA pseudouridine32 synthase/23S rRNA pseudouridine746 synthase